MSAMTNLRIKLLSKLDVDALDDYIQYRASNRRRNDCCVDEQFIKDLSHVHIERLDMLDILWKCCSYWMILYFKTKITKTQLNSLLDNQHIVSALAHILDEEQVMRVISRGTFGLAVGDVLKDNVHYKRRYGGF